MSPPLDGELARRAQAGDREAFEQLIALYLPRVRAFLFRLSGDSSRVDDLAQEVFLAAVRNLRGLDQPMQFGAWIFGIAVRVERARRRPPQGSIDQKGFPEPADGTPARDGAEQAETSQIVMAAIQRLPHALREAFLLRHVEELSAADAARALGAPEGTVRRWDFEARQQLREMLEARGLATERHST